MAARSIALDYGSVLDRDDEKRRIDNISGAAVCAGQLWTVSDEGFSFERLSLIEGGFGAAGTFPLSDYFTGYPPDGEDEADLEGLAADGDRLWFVGSHALTRKKYAKQPADALLGKFKAKRQQARTLLGYVEISPAGLPVSASGHALPLGDELGSLIAEMRNDWPELEVATRRPAKENGLDIEGIAASGNRVFLGLRGPVLGPYGIVVEILVEGTDEGLRIVRRDGLACRPHLIDTGGLGIRDLTMHPKGLIAIVGPTLDTGGSFKLLLAPGPLNAWDPSPGQARETILLCELDTRGDTRRPEAVTLHAGGLLVIYERKNEDGDPRIVIADFLSPPALD